MYLLAFDLINSRLDNTQISKVITAEVIEQISNQYAIDSNLIEIVGGDQLRILHSDVKVLNQLIMHILVLLVTAKLKVRVYVTIGNFVGANEPLAQMTGEIFYRSKELETEIKATKHNNQISIHYLGGDKTEEINLIFNMYSRLVLHKPQYLHALYKSVFENKNQTEIANELGLSQSTVNNQLKKANADLLSSYNRVIINYISEELCKQEN